MNELLSERLPAIGSSPSSSADALDRIGHARSDPSRRTRLIALLDGSRRPNDPADEVGTTRSNLSEQLADLIRAIVALAAELPHCDDHLSPHRPEGSEA